MKLKVWSSLDGWVDREMPLHANFRGLRIKKGSVEISTEELEEHLHKQEYTLMLEAMRNIRVASIVRD